MVEVWYSGIFLWKAPCPSCHISCPILKPFWACSCLVLKLGKTTGCAQTTANSPDPHVLLAPSGHCRVQPQAAFSSLLPKRLGHIPTWCSVQMHPTSTSCLKPTQPRASETGLLEIITSMLSYHSVSLFNDFFFTWGVMIVVHKKKDLPKVGIAFLEPQSQLNTQNEVSFHLTYEAF